MMPSVSSNSAVPRARLSEAGFTLTELMVVVGIIGVIMAISVLIMPSALTYARADSGSAQLVATLRLAREQAIAQRRNVRVAFTAPNRITVSRVEVPGPGTTVLADVLLEGHNEYRLFAGLPDTPDTFGNASPIALGGATSVAFTSTGEFVDQDGDPVNATVFIGAANEPLSARAVSVFGPTALVRTWRWGGTRWMN